jgi:gamma-glutamylcyclotransferase (GGCT)/AIG2-like uncharacterized protein YtfP
VCADNTDPRRQATYRHDGGDDAIQVLFLALTPEPGYRTDGLLVRVDAEHLATLDLQEGGYVRQKVTDAVELVDGAGSLPDVIWTYVTTPEQKERVRSAVSAGTARLRQEYVERVEKGLRAHDGLLDALRREAPLPDVPMLALTRVPH